MTNDILLLLATDEAQQETLAKIHHDPMLSVKSYHIDDGRTGRTELCVANASKALHSPTEPHQMLAKGIVYVRHLTFHYEAPNGYYESFRVVSVPFTKFYNSFEGVAVSDLKEIAQKDFVVRKVMRKLDGTLITRFVWRNKVYFATRGRIINLDEGNEFWELLQRVIATKGYGELYNPGFMTYSTLIGELIGPSNVIVEFHPEDDFVITGKYSRFQNAFLDLDGVMFPNNLTYVEEYNTQDDPAEFVKSWTDVREGVILNFVADGQVLLRVKIKQEAYLNLVRAKNAVSKENLIEMIIENRFKTWDEVETHLTAYLGNSAFFEEMMNFYQTVWPDAIAKVEDVRKKVGIIAWVASEAAKESVRKNQFFTAKKLLDGDEKAAGLVMGLINGKYDEGGLVEIMFNRAKKGN